MPGLFGFAFALVFLFILGIIIFMVIKNISQWNKNNHSPVLIVLAKIVAKRTQVSHHSGNHSMISTTYYASFEIESKDRIELMIPYHHFGQLAEGDFGKLSFQGTRFLSFERNRSSNYNY